MSSLCESCSSANRQQYICLGKIMTGCHGCQATEDAIWEIERGLINCSSEVFTQAEHKGALLGKLQSFGKVHFCVQLLRHLSYAGMNLISLLMLPVAGTYKHIYSSVIDTHMCCVRNVYIDLLSCVCCFLPPRPLWRRQSS